jgi:hypothetical protein
VPTHSYGRVGQVKASPYIHKGGRDADTLNASGAADAGGLQGRVEHIVSGQAVLFTGLEELHAFMTQVLSPGIPPHSPA